MSNDEEPFDKTLKSEHNSVNTSDATKIVNSTVPSAKQNASLQVDTEIGLNSIINNRFKIIKSLGIGGMGLVYQALDKRKQEAHDENPYIAIKILSKDFKQIPNAFVSLQREAQKSQTLAHPNIITVYDFDRQGDDFYMTMEELKGQDLSAFIKSNNKGITIKRAIPIINALANALNYAHSKNIVHSDLKPSNIFIDDKDNVKILDFGIARAISDINVDTDDKTVFSVEEMAGYTPSYASLEMIDGEQPEKKDDIYALGLISYELLTGSHPYHRLPASLALEKGLSPEKIKQTKSYQFKALENALQFKRENRPESVAQFIRIFNGPKMPYLTIIAVLFVALVSFSTYVYFQPKKDDPEVPFSQLPSALQVKITSQLTQAAEAIEFNDFNAALFHYDQAFSLHINNPEAKQGLEIIVNRVLSNDVDEADKMAIKNKLEQINTLLTYPSLGANKSLIEQQQQLSSSQ